LFWICLDKARIRLGLGMAGISIGFDMRAPDSDLAVRQLPVNTSAFGRGRVLGGLGWMRGVW
jgi:hypothetical protein